MRTPRSLVLTLAAGAALLAPAAPAGAATDAWSPTRGFTAGSDELDGPSPRAAIARDGTSAVAFTSKRARSCSRTGTRTGRFATPRVIDRRGASDFSVAAAPGGAFLLAWQERDGSRAAVRTQAGAPDRRAAATRAGRARRSTACRSRPTRWAAGSSPSACSRTARKDRPYGVRALSLDPAGAPARRDPGPRRRRVRHRRAPDAGARRRRRRPRRARVHAREPRASAAPAPAVVVRAAARRQVRRAGRARGDRRRRPARRGRRPRPRRDRRDAGHAAAATPASSAPGDRAVRPDGTLGAPLGPALELSQPRVRAERGADAGRRRARLRAQDPPPGVRHRGAGARRRVRRRRRGGRAADADPRPREGARRDARSAAVACSSCGRAARGSAPRWPDRTGAFTRPPSRRDRRREPYHTNSTNRDLRTAGRYAIFTWARAGRVRVAVRDFGA